MNYSNNNQEPNTDRLEIKVHPNLVGAIQKTVDNFGNQRVISSPLVNMYVNPGSPNQVQPLTYELALDVISNRLASIGLFSSRFQDVDEFTQVSYKDDFENLCWEKIKCASALDIHYPHDFVLFHKSNTWLFNCFQVQFYLEKQLFPHVYMNLPQVVNFRRSSGTIQKGILKECDALRIRTESENSKPNIYVKVYFSIDNPEEIDSSRCSYTKLILFLFLLNLVLLDLLILF